MIAGKKRYLGSARKGRVSDFFTVSYANAGIISYTIRIFPLHTSRE